MANNTDMIKRLPSVFQTVTERKFFDATFDQVFSKRNAERLTGYIGRRVGGEFDPLNDFYLPEQDKDRTRYQLEPTAFSTNIDTLEKTNQFFYQDIIDRLRYYGGNVENHDRLFNSRTYSYSPPIDVDKFINYQNYFWLPDKLPEIEITGITDAQIQAYIVGQPTFSIDDFNTATGSDAGPAGLVLKNGMRVQFAGTTLFTDDYTVEGVNDAILLVPDYNQIGLDLLEPDYITMERGAIDQNAWSRSNKWYHSEVINEVLLLTGTEFPQNATRGQRPIIEFFRDLELFGSGDVFAAEVNYFAMAGVNTCGPQSLKYAQVQRQALSTVEMWLPGIESGDLIVFPCDTGFFTESKWAPYEDVPPIFPPTYDDPATEDVAIGYWDNEPLDTPWDEPLLDPEGNPYALNSFVWEVNIIGNEVVLSLWNNGLPVLNPEDVRVNNGDLIQVIDGVIQGGDPLHPNTEHLGESYYYEDGIWVPIANQKTGPNQPIKFNLYALDAPGSETFTEILNEDVFPNNNFASLEGSHIFSYKVNEDVEATADTVLGFPIVFKALGQISDIVFENDLQAERYSYIVNGAVVPIEGYYYYRIIQADDTDDSTEWTYENSWYESGELSKQRVVNQYTIFDNALEDAAGNDLDELEYNLSVAPLDTSESNMDVYLNNVRILEDGLAEGTDLAFEYDTKNGDPIIRLLNTDNKVKQDDYLQVFTYSYDRVEDEQRGYFEIPEQLEANPNNGEIFEQSYGEFTPHFASIIEHQLNFVGEPLGLNNYYNSAKDPSVGSFILQNESSLLKAMFVSSTDDVDVVTATRFAQNEYVNFKAKFLKVVRQRDIAGFVPDVGIDDLPIDRWLEEVLAVINISKEFSNSFAYSYMIARSDVFTVEVDELLELPHLHTYSIDLSDQANSMYIYKIETDGLGQVTRDTLLLIDRDYVIVDTQLGTTIEFLDSGILSIGDTVLARMYTDSPPAYIPATPAKLGMGPVYQPAIALDTTYLDPMYVIVGHDGSQMPVFGNITMLPDGSFTSDDIRDMLLFELEKRIYNGIVCCFRVDPKTLLREENIRPGYFRTDEPTTDQSASNRYIREEYYAITESFFSKWTAENKAEYRVNEFFDQGDWKTWNYSSQNYNGVALPGYWRGIFRYFYDTDSPDTKPWEMLGFSNKPSWWDDEYGSYPWDNANPMWADMTAGIIRQGNRAPYDPLFERPGLMSVIPVDQNAVLRRISSIFGLNSLGQWNGVDDTWKYGDGAPVEQSWYYSSDYHFSLTEFLYLMRPAEFGEKFWNPIDLEYRNGNQLLDTKTNERLKNATQIVHGEIVDNNVTYRTGYQQYISDRLLFLGKNITTAFGNFLRRADVNLAYKMGAFTNQPTIRVKLESSSAESDTGNLVVPTNNYQVFLYKGASVKDYTYSGVIIRANADSTFTVYGYDLLSQSFKMLPPTNSSRRIQVNQGGTPAEFRDFEFGATYFTGDIIRYNTYFYQATKTHVAESFISAYWSKLAALPQTGGVSVSYMPERESDPVIVPYASVLRDAQEVYDFLIGYGAYLEADGWDFDSINDLNQVQDWKSAASQFLFWVVNDWEPNNALFLSPSANAASLKVKEGYPDSVERLSNGVYSILDKRGVSINPNDTIINRSDQYIQVVPAAGGTGIYYLRVSAKETEHILMFDNVTEFNDVIYQPLLRVRQDRLEFTGIKTLDWFGKLQAGGFLVQDSTLIQNFENLTESIRRYYDTESALDNPEIEEGARHLIGQENRAFLDELEISEDVQFNFYQGFIRQKGTANSVEKLLRSGAIQDKDQISYTEEWAVKLGEFGGTQDTVTSEFVSFFDQVKGDPQAYRFNYALDSVGSVKRIVIFNAVSLYDEVPVVVIGEPTATNDNGLPAETNKQATAVVILGDNKKLEDIIIVDPGYGYTSAPTVSIVGDPISSSEPAGLTLFAGQFEDVSDLFIGDTAYSVIQNDIIYDNPTDTIVDIDIDDTDQWILRPRGLDTRFVVPKIEASWDSFNTPNAGYVHFDDVTYSMFDEEAIAVALPILPQPVVLNDLLWVAKNVQEDWGVYRVVEGYGTRQQASDLRQSDPENDTTDITLDNMSLVTIDENFFTFYVGINTIDKSRRIFNTAFDAVTGGNLSGVLLISVDGGNTSTLYNYKWNDCLNSWALYYTDGTPVPWDTTFADANLTILEMYSLFNQRFKTLAERELYENLAGLTWIDSVQVHDNDNDGEVDEDAPFCWTVFNGDNIYRTQEQLINTALYENSFIRERISGETISRIPVLDPVKDIIPGVADQNIDFKTSRDPARYNNADDPRLLNENMMFGEKEVGRCWWDMSGIRYVFYEQPSLYGIDTPEENTKVLEYRRDNWAKAFPGSTADVYQWTKSGVPPTSYVGTGTPKNITDYAEIVTFNRFANRTETNYYFWVKDSREIPTNRPNRTLTTTAVSRLLIDPRSYNYQWFAPVQNTENSTSIIYANVDSLLSNTDVVVQLNYSLSVISNEEHTQWALLGEGNRFSPIYDSMWDKTVDSLVGYTKPLPADEYQNGLPVDGEFTILPVPNPDLSENEKYGIKIRPQQSMFVDIHAARKIMVQKINILMADIMLWQDRFDNWDDNILTSVYWEYTDWYNVGYDETNTNARRQVPDITGLFAIQDELLDGELVRVYPFNPAPNDRYQIYEYELEENDFVLVRRELGTMKFLDAAYTELYSAVLRQEIRSVLDSLREFVFVDEFVVDTNLFYFAMLNYSFSEQPNIDWAFKTSYIAFLQDDVKLTQRPNYEPDLLGEFLAYVEEAKPYHTKVRDATTVLISTEDATIGNAWDDAIGICLTPPGTELPAREGYGPQPVAPPVVVNGELFTESWRWVDNCVDWSAGAVQLRSMVIHLNRSQVWCTLEEKNEYIADLIANPPADLTPTEFAELLVRLELQLVGECGGDRIDSSGFIFGWGSTAWNAQGMVIAFDGITGLPVGLGDSLMTWQGEGYDYAIDAMEYADDINTIIDAEYFGDVAKPEDMVPVTPSESIVMNMSYKVWDEGQDPQVDPAQIGEYRMNISPLGWTEYIRLCPINGTTLNGALEKDTAIIYVDEVGIIPNVTGEPLVSEGNPGIIWIDNERIEYSGVVADTPPPITDPPTQPTGPGAFTNIRRGTLGTVITAHDDLSTVYCGARSEQILVPENAVPTDGSTLNDIEIYDSNNYPQLNNWDPWLERQLQSPGYTYWQHPVNPSPGVGVGFDVSLTSNDNGYYGVRTLDGLGLIVTPYPGAMHEVNVRIDTDLWDPVTATLAKIYIEGEQPGSYGPGLHTFTLPLSGEVTVRVYRESNTTGGNETFVVSELNVTALDIPSATTPTEIFTTLGSTPTVAAPWYPYTEYTLAPFIEYDFLPFPFLSGQTDPAGPGVEVTNTGVATQNGYWGTQLGDDGVASIVTPYPGTSHTLIFAIEVLSGQGVTDMILDINGVTSTVGEGKHIVDFVAGSADIKIKLYLESNTSGFNESFIIREATINANIAVTNENSVQTITSPTETFNTFVTDPWFGSIVTNGVRELDPAGDATMYNSTLQSFQIISCFIPQPPG